MNSLGNKTKVGEGREPWGDWGGSLLVRTYFVRIFAALLLSSAPDNTSMLRRVLNEHYATPYHEYIVSCESIEPLPAALIFPPFRLISVVMQIMMAKQPHTNINPSLNTNIWLTVTKIFWIRFNFMF